MNATKILINTLPHIDNDISSFLRFNGGTAYFWYEPQGHYKLVIKYYKHTNKYNKYYGDDELLDVNNIKLSAPQLYNELRKLPGVNLDNPYAPRKAIDIMRQEL